MQKEKLTRECIKQDIETVTGKRFKLDILFFVSDIIGIALFSALMLVFEIKWPIFVLVIAALCAVCTYIYIPKLISDVTFKRTLKADAFKVIIDDVVELKEGNNRPDLLLSSNRFRLNGRRPYIIRFRTSGSLKLNETDGDYYRWSKMFCMGNEGVFNYAHIGDDYYVVAMDKSGVNMAYNAKMFEPVGLEIEKAYIDEDDSDNSDE